MADNTFVSGAPRVSVSPVPKLLARVLPGEILQKMGSVYNLGENNADTARFRRYNPLSPLTTSATEGVSPASQTITTTDVDMTLQQWIGVARYTDKLKMMGEKEVVEQYGKLLLEQQIETRELQAFYTLRSGTNVVYANGTARASVASAISIGKQRAMVRTLKAQRARFITEVLASTPNYETRNIEPGFVAVCSSDMDGDIRSLSGFVPVAEYGKRKTICDFELGSVDDVRYITHPIFSPWLNAGAANNATYLCGGASTGAIDVYPVLMFGEEAFGHTALRDMWALDLKHSPPKASDSDPAGQRGSLAATSWYRCGILNQGWIVRGEFAATA
jgi:N4-gp56 family major capsid protein